MNKVRDTLEGWEENIAEDENSATFFDLVDFSNSLNRKDLIDSYSEKSLEDWEWDDILLILGWKYNVANIGLFATCYRGLKRNSRTQEEIVDFFKERLTEAEATSEYGNALESIAEEFDGWGKVSASAFLPFASGQPLFDQHSHRAIKYIFVENEPEVPGMEQPNISVNNFEKYRRNFHSLMEAAEYENSLENVMVLDSYLFAKGKYLKNSDNFDVKHDLDNFL